MVLVLEQFVRNLRESRLIPAEEVASLHKALQASKTPHSVEDVTKLLVQSGKLTAFQVEAISQGRPQSLTLGEYVLLDILGKGGMGVVFRARHRMMDRVVALKTLSVASIKPDTIQRFVREVKAAGRLSHPNIVTAYDAGEQAGTHYLVMEYVVGRDLAAIVKEKGALPLRLAIDYVQQTARGLAYAHEHGVIHRDVKPGNLLLNQDGVVKILDMGLARLNENLVEVPVALDITGAGQILGTIDYMSPEQAEDVHAADHRSDIYSLGCTLFYLLTRRPVFAGETAVKRILAHRDEPIPSVLELRPDCPETLDATVQRMLAKRPEDRPQTMAEIIEELEGCLAKPNAAPPPIPQLSEPSGGAENWLEDLVHEEAAPSTDHTQAKNVTVGFPTTEDLHSQPPKSNISGSTIRRSKQKLPPPAKLPPPVVRNNNWMIVAAATTAAVIVVAIALILIFRHFGGDAPVVKKGSTAAKTKTTAASPQDNAKPAQSGAPDVKPNLPIRGAAWEDDWIEAQKRAEKLIADQRFAQAIHEYSTLADRFHDSQSQQQCHEAIRSIEVKADAAYGEVETAARQHLDQGRFAQAHTALQAALETYGPVPAAERAKKLMEEIDQAEKLAPSEAAKPTKNANPPETPQSPVVSPELLQLRQLDAKYDKQMKAVEDRVTSWNFQGAVQETGKVHFDEPELTVRLASRRKQIQRMADLKDRMIAAINQADPPLKKADLALRGISGEVNKADTEAITTTGLNGKRESLVWAELGPKATNKILALVVRNDDAGDCLAAGLLILMGEDLPGAEKYFDKARSLGTETAPYRALLAAKEFTAVQDLLERHRYADSLTGLTALEKKYGKLPWFAANKPELDAAVKEAKRGSREKEAEGLHAQAAALLHARDLYELKPLVERLKTEFADSAAATNSQRKPSLTELEKAVADLGPLVRVRKDGKGDAKTTIREAVDSAPRNAMIQIEDAGPWTEQIVVPFEKDGLTICGKKGLVPVITTAGAENNYAEPVLVHSLQLSLERLVIVRDDAGGPPGVAITADKAAVSLHGVVVHGHIHADKIDSRQSAFTAGVRAEKEVVAKDSIFFGHVESKSACNFQNVLLCGGGKCGADSRVRHCTINGTLQVSGMSGLVTDCAVSKIDSNNDGLTIEYCDVFGDNPYVNRAAAGKGCISMPPRFSEPKTFDFRLLPDSPCRKAASDGSDMGFTHTSATAALLKMAADVRNRSRH